MGAPAVSDRAALHSGFARTWRAEILARPPLIAPARQFVYPQQVAGEEDTLARGAMLAVVTPLPGGTFLATCARGFADPSLPTGLWACPQADHLLAVSGGYAYLVDTRRPELCTHLALRPVTAVREAVAEGLLLLAGFHHVLALDADGVRWTSARLSWEGVQLHEVRDGRLHGTGWDMFTDRELPFVLDLETGEHTGGGFRHRP